MNEQQARTVLLICALEENDPKGGVISQSERAAATRGAEPPGAEASVLAAEEQARHEQAPLPLSPAGEEFIVRRAELLRAVAERDWPAVRTVYQRTQWPAGATAATAVLAFLLGVFSNEIGAEKRVNILAFPLLGMLVWNLSVYLIMVMRGLAGFLRKDRSRTPSGPLARAVSRLTGVPKVERLGQSGAETALAGGLAQFASDWLKEGRRLHESRAYCILHVCAALLAVGSIGGMYLRGLALEYRAGWESTFLDTSTVHRLLEIVLAPASVMTGIAIPDASEIASMRWRVGFSGTNAASWIHLYAATSGWVIVAPRIALMFLVRARERRLARNFKFSDRMSEYFGRLIKAGKGEGKLIRAVTYSLQLERSSRDRLRGALSDLFGWKAQVDFAEPIAYGAEDEFLAGAADDRKEVSWVIVFNLASTPEPENHGRLIAGLKRQVEQRPAPGDVVLILDESSYRRRFVDPGGLDKRMDERRRLWAQFAGGFGLAIGAVDLEEGGPVVPIEVVRPAFGNDSAATGYKQE